jgi:hypothetical protein
MLKVFGDKPALFKKFRENISKVLNDDKNKALNEFADRYGDDVQHEEYLVQLTAILEQEQDSISTTTVQKIAAIINKVLSTISGGKIVAFQDITDTKELIDFLNNVSGSIREGGDIDLNQSIESLFNQEAYSEGIAIQADPNAEYTPISKSDIGIYEDFPKELFDLLQLADVPINTLKEKIKEYGGRVLITTSDATGYGVDNKGRAIVGGYGFSLNKKNVDAGIGFANVNAATVKKLFTTARKKYGEKKVLVLIMIQSPDTTINNSYGVTYFIESLKKLKNLDNVKEVTEKFGNEKLAELIGSVNAKTDNKEFVKKFIDITTFIERKAYLKKIIPSGKSNRKGVQDFNDINVNVVNFLKEYGDKSFMTPEMIDKNDGNFVVGGFEINVLSKKENNLEIIDIQGKGIEHPLFNAKVPGINHFKLDGPYDVQKNFEAFATPETQIDYTKTTEEEITKLINEKYSDDKYYSDLKKPKNYSNLKTDNKIIFKQTIPSLLKEVTPKIPRNVASGRNFTVDIKEIENVQKAKFEKRPTEGQSKSQLDNKKENEQTKKISTATPAPAAVAGNRLFNKPISAVSEIAKRYYKRVFGKERLEYYGSRKLDKERAKRISNAFISMVRNPNDPQVKKSYEALAKETIDQYKEFLDAGYKVEINNNEPYANSQEMIDDLRNNKSIKIFSTESGFGDTAITDKQRQDNPLLKDSGLKDINGETMLVNDVFRAIHDFFGHAELGNSFGPLGEENAWNVHARMFSPVARRAMTTETRGQNSYVNFSGVNEKIDLMREQARELRAEGKESEAQVIVQKIYEMGSFADQSIGLIPEEFSNIDSNEIGDVNLQPQGLQSRDITEGTSKSQKGDVAIAASEAVSLKAKDVTVVGWHGTTEENATKIKNEGFKLLGKAIDGELGISFGGTEKNAYSNYGKTLKVEIKLKNPIYQDAYFKEYDNVENDGFKKPDGKGNGKKFIEELKKRLIKKGYDGVIFTNEISVFNPTKENIKIVEQSLPTQEKEGTSKSQLTEKNISEMVKKARAEGLSDEAIRERLLNNGISSSDIDIAMESTQTSSSKIEVNEQRMPGYDAMLSKVRGIREKSAARGRSESDTNNSVMAYVMGSDVYKNASDIQREAIVRQIRKYFGLREKSAPKVTNLLDGDMVTVSSKVLVLEKIKALVRGGKDAVKAIKAAQEQLRKEIKELKKSGKITVAQLERVMGRLGKTDLLSPTATARFIDYMGKVFADAEYGQKISDAYKTRSQILSLTKNKDKNVDLKTLGVEFAKIDPSMVEDIDAYNDMAKSIEEAIRGSTTKKGSAKFAASVRISSAMEYVKATLETQERLITEERIAEIQELMGIDATGFSAREMINLLKNPAPLTKYNEPNIRALVSRAFDAYKSIIEQELQSGIDAFTGEPVYYTAAERKAIKEFMEMDTDKMPTAQDGLDAVDSLINFLANKSTAKMMSVTAKYNGQQNAKKVVAKKIESVKLKKLYMPGLARTLAEQTTNLNIVFEKMFKGFNRSRIVTEAMGLLDFINRKAYAQNKSKIIVSDYINTFYKKGVRPNGQAFNTAYNEIERGMAAFMMRNVIDSPEQRAIEFDRRKKLIKQSIDALNRGDEKEKKKAKLYEEAYNKIAVDAEGINDIIANTDKINLDAIDYWHKQWDANFEQMASTSIGIYNKILERESNYSPDRYSKLSEFALKQIDLDDNESAYHTNNGTLYKRAAGSLQKAERPSNLGELNESGEISKVEHYINLSFDRNNSNSMYDALVDIETAASIRQVQAFMNSDDFRNIVPYSEDRALLKNRIDLYIRKSRGKESYSDDELSKFMRNLNKVSTIGVGQALGGVTQPLKQVIPIAFNTIINGGGLNVVSVFDKDFSTWLESIAMPISNRGIQSQTEVDNINTKIQEAADSKGEQLLNLIESANKQWLKIFLVAPDVFIARASWKGYYEKALAKQGIDINGLDYSTHEVNMEAANYAQGMVDRQQNISDHDMSGKAFVSTDVAPQILVKSLMAFASFRMNAASRTAADLSTIGHWSVSTKEDKVIALKSLAGYAVEQAVFKSITVGISLAIGSLALSMMGKDEDDDEFEKRKNNLIKGAATGAVTDIISPIPVTDKVMQELAAWTLDQTQSLVGVSDEDKLSLFGTIKEGFLKGAGTFGIALEKASQLKDLVDLSYSGTYIDDYGKEKKITEKDRDALSMFILPAVMTNIGLAPSEVSSLVRSAVKSSKKAYKTDADRADAEQKDIEEAKENREKINALVELKSNTSSSAEIEIINKKIRELNLEGEEKKEFKKAKEEENKIKNAKKEVLLDGFENQSDMKKYAPEKWEINFGEGSEWYRENNAEMEVNKNLRKEKKEEKEDLYNYVEPSKTKKKSTGWGTVTKKKSTGWGSENKKKNKGWGSK